MYKNVSSSVLSMINHYKSRFLSMPMMTGHFERLIQVMLFYVANSRHGSVIVWNLTSEDD